MILELKTDPLGYIDMTAITPNFCLNKKSSAVAAIKLNSSAIQQQTVGDLFNISEAEPDKLIIRNSNRQLDHIGAEMTDGEMLIEGNTGSFLARNMSGGTLQVDGSVNHHAAGAMSGGMLKINGNAGNFLGGALPGATHGMSGGTVIVKGHSRDRSGDRMRSGLLVIKGNTGGYCASRMIAGSIVLLGKVGPNLGVMMRRGSLITSSSVAINEKIFSEGNKQEISFLCLLIKHLHTIDKHLVKIPATSYATRYMGDLSVGGIGEIMQISL